MPCWLKKEIKPHEKNQYYWHLHILQLEIIITFSVLISMFVFNQDQNLTLILTAACNLKLLSKFYFLPLRLKKTASQTWWFSWGKRNFQTPVFRGQLSSEEWKIQQYFARWSSFFYLHRCCSSHFERYSVLLWYEPHSIQCLAFAQHQLGQPWVQEKIFQEQIRHFLQLCVGQYSPEISRKKV